MTAYTVARLACMLLGVALAFAAGVAWAESGVWQALLPALLGCGFVGLAIG